MRRLSSRSRWQRSRAQVWPKTDQKPIKTKIFDPPYWPYKVPSEPLQEGPDVLGAKGQPRPAADREHRRGIAAAPQLLVKDGDAAAGRGRGMPDAVMKSHLGGMGSWWYGVLAVSTC